MKRAALALVAVAATVVSLDVLADLTQSRPDRVHAGSRTEIVLDVRNRGTGPGQQRDVEGLWGACQASLWQQLTEGGMVTVGDGRYLLTLSPAVGEHAWRKLQGCLEDMTIDRVRGHVVSKRDVRGLDGP